MVWLPVTTGQLADQLATLEAESEPLTPVLRRLAPVPAYGPLLAAAPDCSTPHARRRTWAGRAARCGPALQQTDGKPALERFVAAASALGATGPDLADQIVAFEILFRLPKDVCQTTWPPHWRASCPWSSCPRWAPGWAPVVVAPGDGRPVYLSRGGAYEEGAARQGWLISALGALTVEGGRIAAVDFVDSYEVFRAGRGLSPSPPPMAEHMGIQLLARRDATGGRTSQPRLRRCAPSMPAIRLPPWTASSRST